MKLKQLIQILDASIVYCEDTEREINGGYAGDFLSFVMGKAPEDCAWYTVMSNVNVAAVALLAGVGVTILCEGVKAEQGLVERAKKENLNLIQTSYDVYSAIVKVQNAD